MVQEFWNHFGIHNQLEIHNSIIFFLLYHIHMCDQNDGLYNFKLNFALDVSKFRIGQNGKLENPT